MTQIIQNALKKDFITKFLKFAVIGGIGTFINLGILFIFTEILAIYYIVSEIIAFVASLTNNYFLNKRWTFRETIEEKVFLKYSKYFLICVLSLLINLSVLFILVELFSVWYIIAEIFAIMVGFFINFLGNYTWTFEKG